jgi:WD40 repeat protein
MTGHFSAVSALIFSQDDQNIISGGTDGIIKIWDTGTGREMVSVDTKKGFVRDLEFDFKNNILTAYFDRENEGVFEMKFPNLSEIDSLVGRGFSDLDPQD